MNETLSQTVFIVLRYHFWFSLRKQQNFFLTNFARPALGTSYCSTAALFLVLSNGCKEKKKTKHNQASEIIVLKKDTIYNCGKKIVSILLHWYSLHIDFKYTPLLPYMHTEFVINFPPRVRAKMVIISGEISSCLYDENLWWQGCSQPHSPGWASIPPSSFFPQISIKFSYFSSNFTYLLPHFGPPGGRLAHQGRPWLRHCVVI